MNNYKELKLWQKSVELAAKIYELTTSFPKEEVYGLTSQIKRSAISIPSNIAEGAGRNTKRDFNNFLGISTGSSYELETQLIIANKVCFLSNSALQDLQGELTQIQKMNYALKHSLTKD